MEFSNKGDVQHKGKKGSVGGGTAQGRPGRREWVSRASARAKGVPRSQTASQGPCGFYLVVVGGGGVYRANRILLPSGGSEAAGKPPSSSPAGLFSPN